MNALATLTPGDPPADHGALRERWTLGLITKSPLDGVVAMAVVADESAFPFCVLGLVLWTYKLQEVAWPTSNGVESWGARSPAHVRNVSRRWAGWAVQPMTASCIKMRLAVLERCVGLLENA